MITGALQSSSWLRRVCPQGHVALKTARPVRIYDIDTHRFGGLAHVIDLAGYSYEALADIVALCPAAPCLDVLCAVRELTIDAAEIEEVFI
jgi:hypothetical protein